MNYQKQYDSLIERGKNRVLKGYSERHHIIPKCMGGSNDKENLVRLTGEEHFEAHFLLTKIYSKNEKLNTAAFLMLGKRNNGEKIDAKEYEKLRKKHAKTMRVPKGPMPEEHKKKLRGLRGPIGPMPEEQKKNMRKPKTKEHKKNMRGSRGLQLNMKGPKAEEHKKNIGKAKWIPIFCTTNGIIYLSISEAARKLDLHVQNICKVLKGLRKQTGGYHFEYVKENK